MVLFLTQSEGQKRSGLFFWPSSRSDSGLQAKADGAVLDPVVVAEGEAAAVAVAEGGEFRFRLGVVYPRAPFAGKGWFDGSFQPTAVLGGLVPDSG